MRIIITILVIIFKKNNISSSSDDSITTISHDKVAVGGAATRTRQLLNMGASTMRAAYSYKAFQEPGSSARADDEEDDEDVDDDDYVVDDGDYAEKTTQGSEPSF